MPKTTGVFFRDQVPSVVADNLYLAGEGVDVCFSPGLKQCFFGWMAGIGLPKQVASVVFDKFDRLTS